ncbi:MAG: sulfotransferase domain-containing protein [Rhodothermales bacterium]
MIVVSASLKKSGSGWYFNMTNDLLVRAGHTDVRELRRAYRLQSVLRDDNCRINPNLANISSLLFPHFRGHTFVVKTHAEPTPSLRMLLSTGLAKATYIYRDPRDVVLSALEHGERVRKANQSNILAELHSVEDAVRYVNLLLNDWEAWTKTDNTLVVRYEDLLDDTLRELSRLAQFLALDVSLDDLKAVAACYQIEKQDQVTQDRLHFNKGVAGRFRQAMSPKEIELCMKQFGPYLQRMGYAT